MIVESKPMIGEACIRSRRFALGHVAGLRDIEQHDVAQFGGGAPMGGRRADVAGPDDRDLRPTHDFAPYLGMNYPASQHTA